MELTAAQTTAAIALAEGKKAVAVAKAAKVTRETIRRWSRIPEFAELIATTRRELWQAGISRAVAMVDDALEVARAIALGEDPAARPSDKLAACKVILDLAGKLDAMELEARITALEAREAG